MSSQNRPIDWLALHSLYLYDPKKAHVLLQETPYIPDLLKKIPLSTPIDWNVLEKLLPDWIPFDAKEYPDSLRQIPEAPLGLFFRGSSPRIFTEIPWIGIVGSRKATAYGKKRAFALAQNLARKGFGVISGLAYGIDGAAHEGALSGGGMTVGVMGTGLDQIYPPEHQALSKKMCVDGGILTEFFPGVSPQSHHFPQRNRIISGLSLGVVIVEAAERSGSLITARWAADQGREVFVVPGETGLHTKGSNRLLKEGAKLVEDVEEILAELKPQLQFFSAKAKSPTATEEGLLQFFSGEAVSAEALVEKSGKNVAEIMAELTHLECQQRIKRLPGNVFIRERVNG